MSEAAQAHYPGRAPIDAYGNGGFRFADMSHRGSILCLPSGIYGWPVDTVDGLRTDHFDIVLAEADRLNVLLLGSGAVQVFPGPHLVSAFAAGGIGLEPMDTGAACRTYNVLLGEGRAVGAALIAVD